MNEDDELQDKELARLYREAAREQPSAQIDARMLAAARAAARPAAVPADTSWISSWRIPVALAATVLLSFTLTLLIREGEKDGLAAPDRSTGTARPAQRSTDAEPKTIAPAPAAPPSAPFPSTEQRRTQPRAATPEPKVPSGAGPAASGSGSTPHVPPQTAPKSEAFVRDPAAGAAGKLSRERTMQAAPEAPVRDDLRSGIMKDRQQKETARPEAFAAPPAAVAAPSPALRGQLPPASAAVRANAAEKADRSPEQWLAEIRKLKQAGKTAEAETSLVEFRKRYPQHSVPEDLK